MSEESARRRSQRNSANSEVNKVSTPSIEIPYYTPGRSTNSDKDTALPLVNFKISNYSSTVTTSDSNKSCGIPRKTTIKRSVDLILKSSRFVYYRAFLPINSNFNVEILNRASSLVQRRLKWIKQGFIPNH